jgi:hypothetical protein
MRTLAPILLPLCLLPLCLLPLISCGGPQQVEGPPPWSTSSVDFGQGQLHLGLRFRWVAKIAPDGAVIDTPDGGGARVHIFACGKPVKEVLKTIQARLRSRLIGSRIIVKKRTFFFRWRKGKAMTGKVMGTAATTHGPLLISVTSSTLTMEDLVGVVRRVRLSLPVPTISSCLPLCGVGEEKCVPQDSEDEG